MNLYCVVNVDIVKSRSVKDREKLLEIINQLLINLNNRFADILTAPAVVTLGDEFQAILSVPSEGYNYIHYIQQYLWKYNIDIYAGIGIGEISTNINKDVRMMDGPCFHMAREAMNSVKSLTRERSGNSHNKKNRVIFHEDKKKVNFINSLSRFYNESILETAASAEPLRHTGSFSLGDIINTLIENTEILKSQLTLKQKKAYVDYVHYGSYRKMIEAYPKEERETAGSISQKLKSAEYFTIKHNHEIVAYLLELYSYLRGHSL